MDSAGNAWISGSSDSPTFPQVWQVDSPPAYGESKAYVARLAESGAWLWRSTFVPTTVAAAMATDANGNAFVAASGATLLKIAPQPR